MFQKALFDMQPGSQLALPKTVCSENNVICKSEFLHYEYLEFHKIATGCNTKKPFGLARQVGQAGRYGKVAWYILLKLASQQLAFQLTGCGFTIKCKKPPTIMVLQQGSKKKRKKKYHKQHLIFQINLDMHIADKISNVVKGKRKLKL